MEILPSVPRQDACVDSKVYRIVFDICKITINITHSVYYRPQIHQNKSAAPQADVVTSS